MTRAYKGFTLVEILIVVIILGILAAIVIPRFTNASDAARSVNLTTQLQNIRSQIGLYKLQHNDNYPNLSQVPTGGSTVWDQLVLKTDTAGAVYALTATTGTGGVPIFGPYLQQAPSNLFENTVSVSQATPIPADAKGKGWVYDNTTGTIKAVISSTQATLVGLSNSNDIAIY